MRQTIVTAIAAFALGGITTGVLLAQAQPAGAPPDGPDGPRGMMGRGPGTGPGMGPGWGRGMDAAMGPDGGWRDRMGARHAHRMEMLRTFALIHRADDRKLTPPDVQKIAEAFLLWNGNHAWKVVNVRQDGDAIGFDLATGEGSVIARFSMDPKDGHVLRRG